MSGDTVTSGATTVTTISRAPIRVKEIQFLSVPASGSVQLRNHVVNANVTTPEWEYDVARRLIRRQSPYMRGPDVEKVQDSLVTLGYSVGSHGVDGVYGGDTERAVRRFQDEHGLLLDGIVGPETRTFLGLQGAACYPINTQFVILVRFSAPTSVTSADIWATDVRDGFGGLGSDTNPSQPVTVTFTGGVSNFYRFMIRTPQPVIFKNRVQWLWKCRNINGSGSGANNMEKTEHLIYTVYQTPQPPMSTPWIAVLHKACVWAANETDAVGAASMVTVNVNSARDINNNLVLQYDIVLGASFYSSSANFDCTEYLERLNGGAGNGGDVNCTDCACMVTTFANALGCELHESEMGYNFRCNEIISIGFTNWAVPFGRGFSYHEVAWTGTRGNGDELYDACLKVDGDANPTTSPHSELLPLNLLFHVAGSTLYKERLAADTSDGRPNCIAQPLTGQRRVVI
jgi:hypothetical protein